MCMWEGSVPQSTCTGQRTTFKSLFSPCTMWVQGLQLRLSGLAASTSNWWTISPAPTLKLMSWCLRLIPIFWGWQPFIPLSLQRDKHWQCGLLLCHSWWYWQFSVTAVETVLITYFQGLKSNQKTKQEKEVFFLITNQGHISIKGPLKASLWLSLTPLAGPHRSQAGFTPSSLFISSTLEQHNYFLSHIRTRTSSQKYKCTSLNISHKHTAKLTAQAGMEDWEFLHIVYCTGNCLKDTFSWWSSNEQKTFWFAKYTHKSIECHLTRVKPPITVNNKNNTKEIHRSVVVCTCLAHMRPLCSIFSSSGLGSKCLPIWIYCSYLPGQMWMLL